MTILSPRASALVLAPLIGLASLSGTATSASTSGCAGRHAGGEWTSYGGNLRNTRSQPLERTINAANAASLELAWSFTADGTLHTVPITGGGCLYAADDNTVYALNADTGQLVWKRRFEGGTGLYSVAYHRGRIYANVTFQGSRGPSGVALDSRTGRVVYISRPVSFGVPGSAIASAVAWGNYQLVVTTSGEGATQSRTGAALLDNRTGRILAARPFVPDAQYKRGDLAGGMWATPAVDERTGFAYGATGDPPSSQNVPYCCQNSLVKIDVSAQRRTAASIVDWYAGTPDTYIGGIEKNLPCDQLPQPAADAYYGIACLQQDMDFGASPLLTRGVDGRLVLADLQKSGEVHAVDAGTMAKLWSVTLPAPLIATGGNTASPATDGRMIYVPANPGVLYALDLTDGTIAWRTPDPGADNVPLHPPALANGVLYKVGTGAYNGGFMDLVAFDASTGRPIFVKSMAVDAGAACAPYTGSPAGTIGGVSVARNTVYAVCDATLGGGGQVLAYRLPR